MQALIVNTYPHVQTNMYINVPRLHFTIHVRGDSFQIE